MKHRILHLVAYDISDNHRRNRALRAVRAFGLDAQKSVHECALTRAERRELTNRLRGCIEPVTDRLLVLPLDPRSSVRALTSPARPARPPLTLVIT